MNNARKTEPDSRMLERTRTLDYVTRQGLSTLTGCDATDLDIFCLKELIDNALDACLDISSKISIVLDTQDFLTLRARGELVDEIMKNMGPYTQKWIRSKMVFRENETGVAAKAAE